MSKLSDMPNIGKVLSEQLPAVGLDSPEKLLAAGSREAFTRIRMIDPSACISRLYALEGAVRGVRWHNLPQGVKDSLKEFLASL